MARVLFASPEGDFSVVVGKSPEGEIRLKGALQNVEVGETILVDGRWTSHHLHGHTFQAETYAVTRPSTLQGIEDYLGSGVLPGIGPGTAAKIVSKFGEETLTLLDETPSRLLEVDGVGEKKLRAALEGWAEHQATRRVMLFLTTHGVSPKLASKIYRAYGEGAIERLKRNPYLITELDRVGFMTADQLAVKLGLPMNHPARLSAGLLFYLRQAEQNEGHSYLPVAELLTRAKEALKLEETPGASETLYERLIGLADSGKVVMQVSVHGEKHVYTPSSFRAETRLATRIRTMAESAPVLGIPDQPEAREVDGFTPTEEQWHAIRQVISSRLTILTGKPGVGKCLEGGTLINVNGDCRPIQDVWQEQAGSAIFDGEGYWSKPKNPLVVPALNQEGKMINARVTHLYRQKVKETGRKVCLQDGSEITMTEKHRLHGIDDWQREIKVGEHMCVPGLLPEPSKVSLDPRIVSLAAWQLAEGCESNTNQARITQADKLSLERLRMFLVELAGEKGFKINSASIREGRPGIWSLCVTSKSYRDWLEKQLGYRWGDKSATKKIPPAIMSSPNKSAALFLSEYFACEASVNVPLRVFEITTASPLMCRQLNILMRRFGVWGNIHKKRKCATNGLKITRDYWTITVSGPSLRRLRDQIGIADPAKTARLNEASSSFCNANLEIIPSFDLLPEAKAMTGLSHRFFDLTSSYFDGKKNCGRLTMEKTLAKMDELLSGQTERDYKASIEALMGRAGHRYKQHNLEALDRLPVEELRSLRDKLRARLERGVYYSRVVKVEPVQLDGWVYDLEVEEHHNYVAGGMVTHNTASTRALCTVLAETGKNVYLCAPTGKAAKRMSEATGREARTIHRMLGWSPYGAPGGGPGFTFNQANPLECDVLVVDEASMLDLQLADQLFQAVGDQTHVVLVGDTDQLPSVGAGKVLEDIIASRSVPVTTLTKIFRQAARSMIIQAAYAVNARQIPSSRVEDAAAAAGLEESEVLRDFFFKPLTENEEILRWTMDYATERIPRNYGWDPIEEIQVVAPQRTTVVGVNALNEALQSRLNPHGVPLGVRGFRVGDKLLNTRNDHARDVMNGEFAMIRAYDPALKLVDIEVDGREIQMGASDLAEFYQLAYAVTIHKMQGSSAKAIVIPLSVSFFRMLTKNLLYTAITRAEELCMIIGHPKALAIASRTEDTSKRYTALGARLLDPSLSGQLV